MNIFKTAITAMALVSIKTIYTKILLKNTGAGREGLNE
jgi:hypothetical protein